MSLFGNLFGGSSSYDPPALFNADGEKQQRLERYKKTWEAYLAELPDLLDCGARCYGDLVLPGAEQLAE